MSTDQRDEGRVSPVAVTDYSTIPGMYFNYYLDYASYVILERAIPALSDGLKPVQRRILYSLKDLDDGRFHKIANVIGNTMRFHPHGDAAIGDAIITLGQKHLLIETQGNWGNIYTGDSAAAPRYIEGRLTEFAREVLFNHNLTEWTTSYDGRAQEPVHLPAKFPLILQMGTDGIAVGLSTKILPHNFCEILEASIAALRNEPVEIFPDFPTAGIADFSDYSDGKRGGRVRVRARMEVVSPKMIRITEIPFGTTTSSIIESILTANEKGKIKIKHVDDNTAKNVEILVHLPPGASPELTIDALYAFTRCEESISPNCCIVHKGRPVFHGVSEIVRLSAFRTRDLLERELQIRRDTLIEKIFSTSIERIFIEEKIYRHIEGCDTWKKVIDTITGKLIPFHDMLSRSITQEDVEALTEIRIKRISKYDKEKAQDALDKLENELDEVERHLKQMTRYTVAHFKRLLKDYGTAWPRKTEIDSFKAVKKIDVVATNTKLFVNFKDGFIGWALRKDTFVTNCSDLDEIICITRNGLCKVVRIAEKLFVNKDLEYVAVYRRGDEDTIYNILYWDPQRKSLLAKRCVIPAITRDKQYDILKADLKTKILFLAPQNNQDEVPPKVLVSFKAKSRSKAAEAILEFADVPLRSRDAGGFVVSHEQVTKVARVEEETDTSV